VVEIFGGESSGATLDVMEEHGRFLEIAVLQDSLRLVFDPGIEFEKALQQPDKNLPVSTEPLQRFLELNSGVEDKAKRVLENRNLEEAAMFFHSIKGGAGNLSAKNLYHKTSLLEDLSRSGDFEAIKKELPAFFDLFVQLKAAVDDVQNG